MSIFGAMFSGVSGLISQSQALGMISDNISNVNTTGYKRSTARFSTLVTRNATQNSYSPGGVQTNPYQEVAIQGLLQSSSSQTDIAIVGGGFFVVNEVSNPGLQNEFLYTRAGSFAPDKSGFLRNTAGFYLMGWPTDANGVPTVGNTSVLSSLSAINVAGISGSATPTSEIGVGANLPATSNIGTTQTVTAQVFDSLGIDHNVAITFTKTAQNQWDISATPPAGAQTTILENTAGQIYAAAGRIDFDAVPTDGETVVIRDATATNPDLTFEFDSGGGVTAGNIAVDLTGVTSAAQVAQALYTAFQNNSWGSYDTDTVTNNVTVGGDVDTFASPTVAAATTGITPAVDAVVQGLLTGGDLVLPVEVTGGGTEIRFTGIANLKYGINGGAPGAAGANSGDLVGLGANSTVELYVNDGANDILIGTLTLPTAPTVGVAANDGAEGNVTVGPFARQADPRVTIGTGLDNDSLFLTQGSSADEDLTVDLSGITVNATTAPPAAITQATGATQVYTIPQLTAPATAGIVFNTDGTPASFNVASMDITYSNGAAPSTGIAMDFGTVGEGDAMTQFANDFILYFLTQDGVRFGTFNGVTIGEDGLVTALFDNGQSTPIYQVPLVTFPNPNGLFAKSGNVFAESDASGNGLINVAGTGSAGTIAAGALEASSVDIATEFTNMIVTQQAYSASARIITTADEMLEEVVRIGR